MKICEEAIHSSTPIDSDNGYIELCSGNDVYTYNQNDEVYEASGTKPDFFNDDSASEHDTMEKAIETALAAKTAKTASEMMTQPDNAASAAQATTLSVSEATPSPGKKSQASAYDIARGLLKSNRFAIIHGMLHIYQEGLGYWKYFNERESGQIIRRIVPDKHKNHINKNVISEIYEWLRLEAEPITPEDESISKNYVNFANGVWDIDNETLLPPNPDFYQTYVLSIDYNKPQVKFKDTSWYEYFQDIFDDDKDTISCFEEFIGLAISNVRDTKNAFFIYGPSNTGKSVILNVLCHIIGYQFTSSLSFSQLGNEFYVANLAGKMLNISGEMSGVANKHIDIFKSLTGNDAVNASFKGKDSFEFRNTALLVFACNHMPKIQPDFAESFISRIIVFPFYNVIPRELWKTDLEKQLIADIDPLIHKALKGLKRLKERNYCFEPTPTMTNCLNPILAESNSFVVFAREHLTSAPDNKVSCYKIRKEYQNFCDINNYQQESDNVWPRTLKQLFTVCDTNITSGDEIDNEGLKYNSRGYKGIRLVNIPTEYLS